ncbi:DUF930 domain-containing protein [Neorhizobium sp. P12A]|nr:DUF930 domain-containing protein [Neorhizobium sp. P12A]
MENTPEKRRGKFGRIVAASIAVHLVVAALIFVRLPDQQTPEKEDAVNVDLVPPPEEKKPEQQMAQKAPEPQPEKKAEKAPEPPPPAAPTPEKQEGQQAPQQKPPQEKTEEKKAEPPPPKPEEKPPEKAPEPPKPPEQKPPEAPKPPQAPKPPERQPEPPKPPEPQKEEAKAEEPPKPKEKQPQPPKQEVAQAQPEPPIPTELPVHEYTDKDAGHKSPDDNATEDSGDADGNANKVAEAAGGKLPSNIDDAAKPGKQAQSASPVAKDINLPETDVNDVHSENDAPNSDGDGSLHTSFATEKKLEDAKPPTDNSKPGAKTVSSADAQDGTGLKLKTAKTLFSTEETSDPTTVRALRNLPRGTRFGTLCYNQLVAQLTQAEGHFPTQVPNYPGVSGNTLNISRAAFQDPTGVWRRMIFKCEVNNDATKVVSFSFDVGGAVPRSEWKSLQIRGD